MTENRTQGGNRPQPDAIQFLNLPRSASTVF